MAEIKEGTKFTEEEMKKVEDFRNRFNTVTVSYGQLAMDKLVLEETENAIKEEYDKIRKEEKAFVKELSDKYGAGQLNLETGVFIAEK
jgi:hypothetical protein|tara:strand:- start:24 stop:287 length:264 start_codon:yes stop_codon:yes gene_type:complete